MKTNKCSNCKETKPIDQFYKSKVYKGGIDYLCKYCRTGSAIKSQHRHKSNKSCTAGQPDCPRPHYSNNMCKNCYERNRRNGTPIRLNQGKEIYKNNRGSTMTYEQLRIHHLKSFYSLTVEQFEEMSKDGCHICGNTKPAFKQLHVDHDHKHCDGQVSCGLCVRGILCDSCNVAVGKYEKGKLRADYPKRESIILYVGMHDALISDRISKYDEEQRNRQGQI